MKILLIEPFFTASHQQWATSFATKSKHDIHLLKLEGRHWKWRMHGAAITLAKQYLNIEFKADLILATDMLDITSFMAIAKKKITQSPILLYFHENQLTYPWSPTDQDVALKRDNHYGFINYTSALAADATFFNSYYHRTSFLEALPSFLKQFPDYQNLETIEEIAKKSQVLPLGLDLKRFNQYRTTPSTKPTFLWNHRWEYDKNPKQFFQLLFQLKKENYDFDLIVLGESYHKQPPIFQKAKEELSEQIIHWGYAVSFEQYSTLLWQANLYLVTNQQDFFGGSVVEAIYTENYPLLPKRLAYPEHIDTSLHETHFYSSQNELYQKTKKVLDYFPHSIQNKSYKEKIKNYDWLILLPIYERTFESFIKS